MKRKHFRTIWHPIFYTIIRKTHPRGYRVQYEVPLGTLPPCADLLIIRKVSNKVGRIQRLPSLYGRLGEHTILEYKGATSGCEASDVGVLLGYGSLYASQRKLEVSSVRLMLLASRLEARVKQALEDRKSGLREVEAGVWEGRLAGHTFYFFELEEVGRSRVENEVLRMATREMLDEEFTLKGLTKETAALYYEIGHALKGPVHYREEDMEGQKRLEKSYGRGLEKVLSKFPVKVRLAGLSPEDRVAGLSPLDRLAGLSPLDRLAGLSPVDRLAGLSAEEIRSLIQTFQAELSPEPPTSRS
ncbi:MAG: hypothetical protein ACKO6N_03710 [Myxococcota bacterium]